jgi:hypothetical protein
VWRLVYDLDFKGWGERKGTYAGNDGTHCGLCLSLCELGFSGLLVYWVWFMRRVVFCFCVCWMWM